MVVIHENTINGYQGVQWHAIPIQEAGDASNRVSEISRE